MHAEILFLPISEIAAITASGLYFIYIFSSQQWVVYIYKRDAGAKFWRNGFLATSGGQETLRI